MDFHSRGRSDTVTDAMVVITNGFGFWILTLPMSEVCRDIFGAIEYSYDVTVCHSTCSVQGELNQELEVSIVMVWSILLSISSRN